MQTETETSNEADTETKPTPSSELARIAISLPNESSGFTVNPVALFTKEGTTDVLQAIKDEVAKIPRDISTKSGRAEIASVALRIAKSKVYLDETGKELVAGWKAQSAAVDAERKRIRDELDGLKESFRKPLTDWENEEKERINWLEVGIREIESLALFSHTPNSSEIKESIRLVPGFSRDWREFYERSEQVKSETLTKLNYMLESALKREHDAAELTRLKQEEAERKQRERDERIARESAERAKAEAERVAREQAEREASFVKAERERLERQQTTLKRQKEEAEAKAKQAESLRRANEEKALREKREAQSRADRDKAEAVRRERERVENERKRETEAVAKREANEKHRIKILDEIVNAFIRAGMDSDNANYAVEAMVNKAIPHIQINY